MAKKQRMVAPHVMKQWHAELEDWDELEELEEVTPIRRQPREVSVREETQRVRRQRQRDTGREIERTIRTRRRETSKP
jgi:hypothetical protein